MHDFISKNKEAFALFVDGIYENVIQEENHNRKE